MGTNFKRINLVYQAHSSRALHHALRYPLARESTPNVLKSVQRALCLYATRVVAATDVRRRPREPIFEAEK